MLADIIDILRCPVCGRPLRLAEKAMACDSGHSFDLARQGYLNLLAGGAHTGTADTAEMVAAREAFLSAGHFSAIEDAVAEAVAEAVGEGPAVPGRRPVVVEVGAGTGHYLARALDAAPDALGIAIDISKHAAKRAARAGNRIASLVADAWKTLPLADASVDVALVVFAPRNAVEFRRLLAPSGSLVVVTPSPEHLREIAGPLGLLGVEEDKRERLVRAMEPWFELADERRVEARVTLSRAEAVTVAAMGPSAHHASEEEREQRAQGLPDTVEVTVSVVVSVFRPKAS